MVTFWPPIQNHPLAVSLSCRAPSKPFSHNLFIRSQLLQSSIHTSFLIALRLFILHDNGAQNSISVDLWCMFQGKRRPSKKTGGSVQEASLKYCCKKHLMPKNRSDVLEGCQMQRPQSGVETAIFTAGRSGIKVRMLHNNGGATSTAYNFSSLA